MTEAPLARRLPHSAPASRPPCREYRRGTPDPHNRLRWSAARSAPSLRRRQPYRSPAPSDPALGRGNTAQPHAQHKAVEAGVGNEQVAAAAEHEERRPVLLRPFGCLGDLLFVCSLDKPAGRAAYTKGGEGSKRRIFVQDHEIKATSPDLAHLNCRQFPCRRRTCIQN